MRDLCLVQGVYFLATGVWPLVDIHSFQKVTGPKRDLWLVKTVGVVVGVIGAVLLVAGVRDEVNVELALLGAGSALGLTAIDVIYVARRVISKIYLVDAAGEIILIAVWAWGAAAGALH